MSGGGGGISELGAIEAIVAAALAEDLGSGDLTGRLTVPANTQARGRIVAKQALTLAGAPVIAQVFAAVARLGGAVQVRVQVDDGAAITPGTVVAELEGDARSILAGERTALNLLGRACAVATTTRRYVDAAGPELRVVDTRKTMPGLRALDRYAVRCGGGHNHRNDLGAGVLIKENHIRCAGSVTAAVAAAKAHAPHTARIECEVETLDELREAVAAGAEILLLDNMDDDTLREAVAIVGPKGERRVILEVSGGITIERLPRLATLGLDLVSVGALTHSAPNVDLSLLFELG
ncbi:nicotinate-nucleotide pyrophosphorylase [Plesiocystis pacifica SIR-1]|uniref:Probable nicotinate-nucleotide pyrophosphorylase [carboxylating] n=1 Tax=Plesiocystis pacifica SIR-1 TaxID=391625 RepID=A6GG58_9BACT|nr:carboxylating nicotinate-nucleotide diphosphorylase [Plesiocystis pacifica]EDM75127.1 nicotinate-nucleotide pyrophosphorylase [Plesiocystis pacifica SIR-1]